MPAENKMITFMNNANHISMLNNLVALACPLPYNYLYITELLFR